MKAPKEIWIIFDELDGPFVFDNEEDANSTYSRWTDDGKWEHSDEISEPVCYTLSNGSKGVLDGL